VSFPPWPPAGQLAEPRKAELSWCLGSEKLMAQEPHQSRAKERIILSTRSNLDLRTKVLKLFLQVPFLQQEVEDPQNFKQAV